MVQQEVMLARQTASVQQGGIRLSFPIIVHFQFVLALMLRGRLGEVPSLHYIRIRIQIRALLVYVLVHIEYVGKPAANNMSAYAKREMSTDQQCTLF